MYCVRNDLNVKGNKMKIVMTIDIEEENSKFRVTSAPKSSIIEAFVEIGEIAESQQTMLKLLNDSGEYSRY